MFTVISHVDVHIRIPMPLFQSPLGLKCCGCIRHIATLQTKYYEILVYFVPCQSGCIRKVAGCITQVTIHTGSTIEHTLIPIHLLLLHTPYQFFSLLPKHIILPTVMHYNSRYNVFNWSSFYRTRQEMSGSNQCFYKSHFSEVVIDQTPHITHPLSCQIELRGPVSVRWREFVQCTPFFKMAVVSYSTH